MKALKTIGSIVIGLTVSIALAAGLAAANESTRDKGTGMTRDEIVRALGE